MVMSLIAHRKLSLLSLVFMGSVVVDSSRRLLPTVFYITGLLMQPSAQPLPKLGSGHTAHLLSNLEKS